jgi:uncharacterized membrane protein (DUF485 family)
MCLGKPPSSRLSRILNLQQRRLFPQLVSLRRIRLFIDTLFVDKGAVEKLLTPPDVDQRDGRGAEGARCRTDPSCDSIRHAMNSQNRQRLLASRDFRRLIAARWRVSLVLTTCLFVLYYGYILLIALNKTLVSTRMGGSVPIGIPLGAAVIGGSWVLTAAYVVWANRHYDPEVHRLRQSGGVE